MTLTAYPTRPSVPLPACREVPRVFQDPRLEEPPTSAAPAAERAAHAELVAAARATCRRCPLVAPCLFDAVVTHDVAGCAGGTTARERQEIRRRLGVTVAAEDFDTLAGVVGGSRQIDHAEVLRLRAAHPDESLETLARRLRCSLSTVKRHLRRERNAPGLPAASRPRPSLHQVLQVAADVTAVTRSRSRARAA